MARVRLAFLCLALLVALQASDAVAEVIQTRSQGVARLFRTVSPQETEQVLASLPSDQKGALQEAANKTFPVFIFIPGVMGSKLTKRFDDNTEAVIWGALALPNEHLHYRPEEKDRIKASLLTSYPYPGGEYDIYGGAIRSMRTLDLRSGARVLDFAYDWRQSNRVSAEDLSKWLCQQREKIEGKPTVFVAHSMGGLVLKHWLKTKYREPGCEGASKFSDWIDIEQIIFLGTPHHGAPKALAAFADEYSVLVDPNWPLASYLKRFEVNTFSKAVNEYGATFPSVYELLPLNPSDCKGAESWPPTVGVRLKNQSVHYDISVFNVDAWTTFGWPKRFYDPASKQRFVQEKLAGLLEQARTFRCDLAAYDIDKEFRVVRFYGNENEKTPCKIIIEELVREGTPPKITEEGCPGDGTVPSSIAGEEMLRPSADMTRSLDKGHTDLATSKQFMEYLRVYKNQRRTALAQNYKQIAGNVEGLVSFYTAVGLLGAPLPVANEPDHPANEVTRRVIANVTTPNVLYAAAKTSSNPSERSALYRFFANTANEEDPKRVWALNNAAHIEWQKQDFTTAKELATSAFDQADMLPAADSLKIKRKAGSIVASSSEELEKTQVINVRSISMER
jgi:hypothetical protein